MLYKDVNDKCSIHSSLALITIFFKSTGMHRLFGIPMQLFADRGIDFELVCNRQDKNAVRKIFYSDTTETRVAAIEALLLEKLPAQSDQHADRIEYASRLILNHNGNLPVNQLAREVYLQRAFHALRGSKMCWS